MGLIDTLHEQHREIRTHLKKIEINEDQEILSYHFNELKVVLISHLINEDNYLYPPLRSLEAVEKISKSWEDEMGRISSDVMGFYDKYKDGFQGDNYKKDATDVIQKLIFRIAKEERELYPIFKEYFPEK